jgi:hypothetical protein
MSPTTLLADYFCSDAAPDVIRLTVRGSDAAGAKRIAAAVADSFVTAYRASGDRTAAVQSADLLAQRGRLEEDLADVTRSLDSSTYPAQVQSLTGMQKDLLTRIDDLTARASDVSTVATTASAGSRIVDPPVVVPHRSGLLLAAAGGLLGLGVGVGAAALDAVVRERPLRRREIAQALGEPIGPEINRVRHGLRWPHDITDATAILARLAQPERRVLLLHSGCPATARALAHAVNADPAAPGSIQIGALRPPGPWLQPDGRPALAVLLIRPGHESATGLRAATDDLRTAGIEIGAVFLVDPDRHDRTDGLASEAYGRLFELQRGATT